MSVLWQHAIASRSRHPRAGLRESANTKGNLEDPTTADIDPQHFQRQQGDTVHD